MQLQDLSALYETKTDDELFQLLADLKQLTPDAQMALKAEISKRRIQTAPRQAIEIEPKKPQPDAPTYPEQNCPEQASFLPLTTGNLLSEAARIQRRHWRAFAPFAMPAFFGLGICVCFQFAIDIGFPLVIAKRIRPPLLYLVFAVLSLTTYFIAWVGIHLSYAMICSGVTRITGAGRAAFRQCFTQVYRRKGTFLLLCALLYLITLMLETAATLLSRLFSWTCRQLDMPSSARIEALVWFALPVLAGLILTRFALAVPAVIRGGRRTAAALFLSDELTEGKWLLLAAVYFKAAFAAGVVVFLAAWLATIIRTRVEWLFWIGSALKIFLCVPVFMMSFVEFALLYIRTAERRDVRLPDV